MEKIELTDEELDMVIPVVNMIRNTEQKSALGLFKEIQAMYPSREDQILRVVQYTCETMGIDIHP